VDWNNNNDKQPRAEEVDAGVIPNRSSSSCDCAFLSRHFFPFLAPFSAARFHFHKAGHERLWPSTRSNDDDDDDDVVCATGRNIGIAQVFIAF
jgi:hypothetical protein